MKLLLRWRPPPSLHHRTILDHMGRYVTRNLKNRSHTILRLWTDHCEYIAAQRCRRAQQMAALYTRLWEERALRELMRRLRKQIHRHSKGLMLGAAVIQQASDFNWDVERIAYDTMRPHLDEIDFVRELQLATIMCPKCKRRTVIDARIDGIEYCTCSRQEQLDGAAATKAESTSTAAAAKTTTPSVDRFSEWKPYLERQNMVVWRREERPGLYAYKVHASYSDVTAEDFLYVQTDTQYRKVWDKSAVTLDIVDVDPANRTKSQVVYWEMLWPKLFANRDYVYRRRIIVDRQRRTIVIASQSTQHPRCPPQPSKQRVQDYWSYMVIRPTSGSFRRPGLEYVLTYFDNPGVVVPPAVTSWVAQKQMPDFLNKLHQATVAYARDRRLLGDVHGGGGGDEDDCDDEEDDGGVNETGRNVEYPPDPGFEYPPESALMRYVLSNDKWNGRRPGDDDDDDDDGGDEDDGGGGSGSRRRPRLKCNPDRADLLEDTDAAAAAAAAPKKKWSWWSYLWPYYYFVSS